MKTKWKKLKIQMKSTITVPSTKYGKFIPIYLMTKNDVFKVIQLATCLNKPAPTVFEFKVFDYNFKLISSEIIKLNLINHQYEDHYLGMKYDGSKERLVINPIALSDADPEEKLSFELEIITLSEDDDGGWHHKNTYKPIKPRKPEIAI